MTIVCFNGMATAAPAHCMTAEAAETAEIAATCVAGDPFVVEGLVVRRRLVRWTAALP